MNDDFDRLAHELEARLRDLRRLVAEMAILTDPQDAVLAHLMDAMREADQIAAGLRHDLLETVGDALFAPPEEPEPAPLPPLPLMEDRGDETREPMEPLDDAGKLRLLREMRDVAREMDLPFDGADELSTLEARLGAEGDGSA